MPARQSFWVGVVPEGAGEWRKRRTAVFHQEIGQARRDGIRSLHYHCSRASCRNIGQKVMRIEALPDHGDKKRSGHDCP